MFCKGKRSNEDFLRGLHINWKAKAESKNTCENQYFSTPVPVLRETPFLPRLYMQIWNFFGTEGTEHSLHPKNTYFGLLANYVSNFANF